MLNKFNVLYRIFQSRRLIGEKVRKNSNFSFYFKKLKSKSDSVIYMGFFSY